MIFMFGSGPSHRPMVLLRFAFAFGWTAFDSRCQEVDIVFPCFSMLFPWRLEV